MKNLPNFIIGGTYTDQRGTLSFVNDFDLTVIKRMYMITHDDSTVIRAWQGHQIEQKWFYVTEGSFTVMLVVIDNWENPGEDLTLFKYRLTTGSGVLYIPGGYANGFKADVPNSKLMVFSDCTIEQSKNDNYRFEASKWVDWNTIDYF